MAKFRGRAHFPPNPCQGLPKKIVSKGEGKTWPSTLAWQRLKQESEDESGNCGGREVFLPGLGSKRALLAQPKD